MFTLRQLSVLFLLSFVPLGLHGSERSTSAAEDPIAGAIRLLENEISEEVILKWVEAGGGVGGALSSEDVIALRKAGASDSLLAALLDGSRRGRGLEEEEVQQTAYSGPAGVPEPSTLSIFEGREPDEVASVESRAPQSSAAKLDEGKVAVTWILRNGGPSGLDEEEGDRRRDFTVYLDGQLLERLTTSATRAGAVEHASSLDPGVHSIRVTRDLHERNSKKREVWLHEVRVFPLDFSFSADPKSAYQIEILYSEWDMGARKGPVTMRVSQNGSVVVESVRQGAGADRWPRLCDAVTASYADGKESSFAARSQRKGCLDFAGLWPDGIDADWGPALGFIREGGPTK